MNKKQMAERIAVLEAQVEMLSRMVAQRPTIVYPAGSYWSVIPPYPNTMPVITCSTNALELVS